MNLNARQLGELEARDFLGEETWKRWKHQYDECMAYRKTLKGKPNLEQRIQLELNALDIEFYGSVLFHSEKLAQRNRCGCTRCGQKRTGEQPRSFGTLLDLLSKDGQQYLKALI